MILPMNSLRSSIGAMNFFLLSNAFLFYQTNKQNKKRTQHDHAQLRADLKSHVDDSSLSESGLDVQIGFEYEFALIGC